MTQRDLKRNFSHRSTTHQAYWTSRSVQNWRTMRLDLTMRLRMVSSAVLEADEPL
jgi:hypothetical protein